MHYWRTGVKTQQKILVGAYGPGFQMRDFYTVAPKWSSV